VSLALLRQFLIEDSHDNAPGEATIRTEIAISVVSSTVYGRDYCEDALDTEPDSLLDPRFGLMR
jgi:hypothetical protein